MVSIILSIICPIREYTKETHYMILSILASTEKRIEIILGENYVKPNLLSSTLTTAKNEVLKDPRVKYFPSNHYLTMSENWARSVQLSTGLYVAFVGA